MEIHPAKAVETKQICCVSEWKVIYLQPEGSSSHCLHRGWSQKNNTESCGGMRGRWEIYCGDFRSISCVLWGGSYPIAEKSPNHLLKSCLITVHLYWSCCVQSFCPSLWNMCLSNCMWRTHFLPRTGSQKARDKLHTLLYMLGSVRGKDERKAEIWVEQRGTRMRLLW